MIASIISSVFLSTGKYWNSQSNVHIIVKSFVYHYYLYQLFVHPVPDASKPSNNSLDLSVSWLLQVALFPHRFTTSLNSAISLTVVIILTHNGWQASTTEGKYH